GVVAVDRIHTLDHMLQDHHRLSSQATQERTLANSTMEKSLLHTGQGSGLASSSTGKRVKAHSRSKNDSSSVTGATGTFFESLAGCLLFLLELELLLSLSSSIMSMSLPLRVMALGLSAGEFRLSLLRFAEN